MNRVEPNLLVAVAAAFALLLLIGSASLFGTAPWWKYAIIAVVCAGGFVAFNGWMRKRRGLGPQVMVRPGDQMGAFMAGLLPMAITLAASIPLLYPGHDYGLLVLIASVWFGGALQAALAAQAKVAS